MIYGSEAVKSRFLQCDFSLSCFVSHIHEPMDKCLAIAPVESQHR